MVFGSCPGLSAVPLVCLLCEALCQSPLVINLFSITCAWLELLRLLALDCLLCEALCQSPLAVVFNYFCVVGAFTAARILSNGASTAARILNNSLTNVSEALHSLVEFELHLIVWPFSEALCNLVECVSLDSFFTEAFC